jgi:hypothetical protein
MPSPFPPLDLVTPFRDTRDVRAKNDYANKSPSISTLCGLRQEGRSCSLMLNCVCAMNLEASSEPSSNFAQRHDGANLISTCARFRSWIAMYCVLMISHSSRRRKNVTVGRKAREIMRDSRIVHHSLDIPRYTTSSQQSESLYDFSIPSISGQ